MSRFDQIRNHSNTHYMLVENPTTIDSALQEWMDLRKQLSGMIQSYLSKCTNLRNVCYSGLPRSSQSTELEGALAAINSELDSLRLEEEMLHNAHMSLTSLRNRSTVLAPANRLPPEVLGQIFALMKRDCLIDSNSKTDSYSFVGVCTYWRQIALSQPTLWSHVDVKIGINGCCSLPLEWTGNIPIHAHVYEPRRRETGSPTYTSDQAIQTTVARLMPHMLRIQSLHIDSYIHYSTLTREILASWLKHVDAGLAKSLSVSRPRSCEPLGLDELYANYEKPGSIHNKEWSLNQLRLVAVEINWRSNVYRGLVDLQLDYRTVLVTITLAEIYQILCSTPLLVTLKLAGLQIEIPDGWTNPTPVVFSALRTLNLTFITPTQCALLLPLIAVPSSHSELSVGLSGYHDTCEDIDSFLRRMPVTTLCLEISNVALLWPSIFTPGSRITSLALLGSYMMSPMLVDLTTFLSTHNRLTRITSFVLYSAGFSFETLEVLITSYHVEKLYLGGYFAWLGDDGGTDSPRVRLLQKYPGLQLEISNGGPIPGSPHFEFFV